MKTFSIFLTIFMGLNYTLISQNVAKDFCSCEKQTLESEILNQKRNIFIYLPKNYDQDTTKTYPVHYVSDAPATSNLYFDLVRLHAITNNIPQSIVVGLSSDGRNNNFNIKGNTRQYLNFLQNEVIPHVEAHYRVNNYKIFTGHSAGGNFVLYTYLQSPELFNAYIAGSPGPIDQILNFAKTSTGEMTTGDPKFLYSSIGTEDDTDSLSFKNLQRIFKEITSKKNQYHFSINLGENHISNMAVNFQDGFQKLYKDWKFHLPDSLNIPIRDLLKHHYNHIEKKFGYRPEIDQWKVIFPIMDQLAQRGDFQNAIDILEYCIELYPESDQAYAFLAKAHFDQGNYKSGKSYLEKALDLNPKNKFAQRMKMMIESR